MLIASKARVSTPGPEGRKKAKMIRKVVYVIAIVAIAIGVVNDLGRYITTTFQLSEVARGAAGAAARAGGDRETAALAAVNYASPEGVDVYAFDYTDAWVTVHVEMPLDGTWALAPILTTIQGGRPADLYMLRTSHESARQ